MPRPVQTVLYCVALLAAVAWLAARMAPPPVSSDETERDVTAAEMEQALAPLRDAAGRGERLVVVLGDSSLRWHSPLTKDETLTAMLERDGGRAGVTLRVLAHDGFDPVAYYLLVDEIAALRPEAVVLVANFQAFTDDWFRRARMKHPQLAAFVRPARVQEAMRLPLELAGVADASLIVKPVLRAIGANDLPEKIDGYRTRLRERLDGVSAKAAKTALAESGLAHAAQPPAGAPPPAAPAPPMGPGRAGRRRGPGGAAPGGGAVLAKGAFRFTDLYPANLDREQATVRVLAATVRDLVAHDVRTIVLLAPLHLQALKLTGAYVQRNLPQAVRVIAEAGSAGGGVALDLTEALPEEALFADRYTHFTAEGNRRVADRVLDELGRLLEAGR